MIQRVGRIHARVEIEAIAQPERAPQRCVNSELRRTRDGVPPRVSPLAARRGGVNLIIFPDNLARRGALEIVNVGELPARP